MSTFSPISVVSINQWRVMRLVGSLQLVLLLAFTSGASGLNIPAEVEQLPTIITHTSGPIIVLPFDNITNISCEARGNPPPEYRWTKDGREFTPSEFALIKTDGTRGTIVLHNKRPFLFQGKYRCYASNKLGTAVTEEIEISVSSIPKFPKETIEPIVVKEGDPITLKCNPPEGVAPRQLYWMSVDLQHIEQDERVTMGTDGNLYFANALQKDSRSDYGCFASFSKIRTIVQKTAMAVVVKSSDGPLERKPSLLLPSGVQTLKVFLKGDDMQLECIPEGFPTPNITWMKMGDKLNERVELSNFNRLLTLPAVEEKDQGKYTCTAQNSAGNEVHYFDVIVEEPPKWLTEPPQSQLAVIGSEVHIKCSVTGKPSPDITWRRNGEIFEDDPQNNRQVLDDTVVLRSARPEDTAVYQCEASNKHGRVLANVNILVLNMAPLMLTRAYQEYAVVLGGNITLNCSVFSSPPSTISWAKDEQNIEGTDRFLALEDGQSLKIISTQKGDSGKYVCDATNTEGSSSITAVLDVKEPTRIVGPPQHLKIVSGTTAQLRCQTEYDESLQDTFKVVWRKDGEEMPLSADRDSRYSMDTDGLQIMNVNLSDEGRYTCTATTSLDEDTAGALLTVLDVPDAPSALEISELNGTRNVLLSWIPGNDHNSPVTEFVVEYEESQWEPGRWKEQQKVVGNQATAELALHGHLEYQFRVYAVNGVGPGPPSEPTPRHKTSPCAPYRNPENIKIQGPLPHQMDISWQPLLPIEYNGPGLEYRVSYRKLGVDDIWTDHLVQRHSFVVRNTSTFVPYEIKIQSRNSHGWGPEPKVVTGYSGEDVPTAAPRDVAVEVINSTVLRVSWTPPPPPTVRGHLGGYSVHWVRQSYLLNPNKILDEHHSMSFTGKRQHAIVPGLEPFSEYKLTVHVFNKKGNGPKSDPVTFSTPEGVPEQVPILTTSNMQKDSILLVWGPPLKANGILSGYHLQYHLINETAMEVIQSREVKIAEADTTKWQIEGLEQDSLYTFNLSACTRAGCGPPRAEEGRTVTAAVPALLNISSYVSDTFAKISWTAREEQRDSQLYVAYMNNRDGNWRISEAVSASRSFHVIDGLKPGAVYTVRLMAKGLLDNASIYEDVIQTRVKGVATQGSDFSTQGWFIGTMCAVALLTLVALMVCFVRKNKGGKYAGTPPPPQRQDMSSMEKVKEKEDLQPDVESQAMNDDTFYEYSKPHIHEIYQDRPRSHCSHHLMG
ncbi:neural cell adhesion molecule L1-like protein isoform X3 [Mugil cephalus]|uniref:neural cell adhesion molecule L1-like protein isoform X3 n=1 Tax=Mugil cephalus TaxID=48193 RepID=UPI001FB83B68|nr:neural cell adhesion molecule L1-like protein isoform X3 [Mugil cephalus]